MLQKGVRTSSGYDRKPIRRRRKQSSVLEIGPEVENCILAIFIARTDGKCTLNLSGKLSSRTAACSFRPLKYHRCASRDVSVWK